MPATASDSALRDSALLGAAAGLRAFTPPALLAARGDLGSGRLRTAALLGGAGELVGDKLPMTPPRTAPPPLAFRALSGAFVGFRRGGPQASAAAAAVAVVAAYGGQHTRQWLGRVTGRPDVQFALLEDILCVALAAAGARTTARRTSP